MKLKTFIASAAAIAISMAACTDDEPKHPEAGKTGVTVTAGIEKEAQTRIAYEEDDDWTKITWDADETFCVIGSGFGSDIVTFTKTSEGTGVETATFTENGTTITADNFLGITHAVYLNKNTYSPTTASLTLPFSSQDGTGIDRQLLVATRSHPENEEPTLENLNFRFRPKVALLKLTLKNDAFKEKTVTDITLSGTGLATSAIYKFNPGGWTIFTDGDIAIDGQFTGTEADGAVTIYVGQPVGTDLSEGITVTARCAGIDYTGTLGKGTFSEAAVYSAAVEMEVDDKFMAFTIKAPAGGGTFTMPFSGTLTSGVEVTIDWGDGNQEPKITGNGGDVTAPSHLYTKAGRYQIAIKSSATSENRQIPRLKFSTNDNKSWLVSMDTPMLNMNAPDLNSTFYGCSNLKSITAGLFSKNTAATIFFGCFAGCSELKAIPAGLFDRNTEAINFSSCFNNCINLESVPELLFANNKKAINFVETFAACRNLKLNADIFCKETDENKANHFLGRVMDFTYCFATVGLDLDSDDGGTAPALWTYTFAPAPPTTTGCFTNCIKVTNAYLILTTWGGTATP